MSPMGCTYSENSSGPSTESYGTPDVTRVVFDDASLAGSVPPDRIAARQRPRQQSRNATEAAGSLCCG